MNSHSLISFEPNFFEITINRYYLHIFNLQNEFNIQIPEIFHNYSTDNKDINTKSLTNSQYAGIKFIVKQILYCYIINNYFMPYNLILLVTVKGNVKTVRKLKIQV